MVNKVGAERGHRIQNRLGIDFYLVRNWFTVTASKKCLFIDWSIRYAGPINTYHRQEMINWDEES